MRTSAKPGTTQRLLLGAVLALGGALLASNPVVGSAPLKDFTGYTRIGSPPAEGRVDPKISPVAADREGKSLGVTVYYTVLDRRANGSRSSATDTFGTGIADFDNFFVAGKNSQRDRLDTGARYLYLYQVVNDSGREAAVKSVSIRLIIDPRHISSWGYFAEKQYTERTSSTRKGLGFVGVAPAKVEGKDEPEPIRPVSTDTPAVTDTRYRSPAPAVTAIRPYGFAPITLGDRLIPAAATGDEIGREPETVLLVRNADFGDLENPYVARNLLRDDRHRLDDDFDADEQERIRIPNREGERFTRRRSAAVRAIWSDDAPLRKRERSTIFGFTSDYPPTMESVAVGSKFVGITGASGVDDKGKAVIPAAKDKEPGEKQSGVEGITPASGTPGKGTVPAVGSGSTPGTGTTPGTGAAPGTGTAPGSGASPGPGGTGITPASGLGALAGVGAGLAPAIGTVPTPIPPVNRATGSGTAAAPAALEGLGSGSLGSAIGGGLGGMASGGGGAFVPTVPGAPFMAGSGGGAGGGLAGGGLGGGGGLVGGGGQNQNGRRNQDQNGNQNQDQNQGGVVVNNNIRVNVNQNQSQKQKQNQKQNQNQNQSIDGHVIPAPPAWLLGVLGLPALLFARRLRSKPTEPDSSSPADSRVV